MIRRAGTGSSGLPGLPLATDRVLFLFFWGECLCSTLKKDSPFKNKDQYRKAQMDSQIYTLFFPSTASLYGGATNGKQHMVRFFGTPL